MNASQRPYSLLLTDLYQLTMAYGYWKNGVHDREAVFQMTFRKHPFRGGYSIACGLANALEYLAHCRLQDGEREYLATLRGGDDQPLFTADFLDYLDQFQLTVDVDAIPEGTVVFPHEPLIRVTGPILQCQVLESALLNIVNFQTLVATKAARVCEAAGGAPVLEFGLRRAQGVDGALAASRAAFIGGCSATSHVLAGMRYGIPVKGTHAHSWVMSFDDELQSFEAYARAMPNNCVFLVDTYDTLDGVRNAIQVAREMKRQGHQLAGIRLDSGDLAYLSIEARRLLDEAGFHDAAIVASNDLDEHIIDSLRQQGACIAVWGVGTRLVTAYDQPALGGVYKLAAIRDVGGAWQYRIKLSEQTAKVSNPGIQQVRRFSRHGEFAGDMIFNEGEPLTNDRMIIDPADNMRSKIFPADATYDDLLVPVVRRGIPVYHSPSLHEIRGRVRQQLAGFHSSIKRLLNPHGYPVGLEPGLLALRTSLIAEARRNK